MAAKVFSCAVIGDVLAEPDTVVKSMITRRAVASRTSFTGTQAELEAAKASLKRDIAATRTAGSLPTVTTPVVAAGGAEVTIQFAIVQEPEELLAMSPPPAIVLLCYTPVAQATLKSLEVVWVPALTQMFARPQLVLAATRVETLAHQKIMDRVGTKPVTVEAIVDKAASWRAVDYVEVSAACNVNLSSLLAALAMACLSIPAQRITTDLATEQRRECMKPILSTQSVWTYKRHPVTGRVFYGNRITEQSQWTRPDDYDGEEPELTPAEREAEALAKAQLEEKRAREQHERQLEEQSRQEVAVHNERVHELEKRAAALTRDVAHLRIRAGEVRDAMERNRRERDDLERQHEAIAEARFAKSTVDDDLRIERDIADAKIKLFMLEGRVALSDEIGVQTTEIAEAILVNSALATQLRELIAEQLAVRRKGSASQARLDTLGTQHEDATALLAAFATKLPAMRGALAAAEADLKASEATRRGLTAEAEKLKEGLRGADGGAQERQRHIVRLQAEIQSLDKQIAAEEQRRWGVVGMAANHGSGSRQSSSPNRRRSAAATGGGGLSNNDLQKIHTLEAEAARVALERSSFVQRLTAAAADCATFEISSRRTLEMLKYVASEYDYASRRRGEAAGALAMRGARALDGAVMGGSYPISTPYELQQLQSALDTRIAELSTVRGHTSDYASAAAAAGGGDERRGSGVGGGGGGGPSTYGGLNSTPSGRARSSGAGARGTSPSAGSGARRQSATAHSHAFGSAVPTGRGMPTNSANSTTPLRQRASNSSRARSAGPSSSSSIAAVTNASSAAAGPFVASSGSSNPAVLVSAAARAKLPPSRLAAITDLERIKTQLSAEQRSEEAAEALAALSRTAAQRAAAVRSKGAQQSAALREAVAAALREVSSIERLKGYEGASPLERLVALVDESSTASVPSNGGSSGALMLVGGGHHSASSSSVVLADGGFFGNFERDEAANAALVAEVANAFTERMLRAVPPSERAALAQQLNSAASRDAHPTGPAPSAAAIADAVNGTAPLSAQAHAAAVDAAAKRGVLAATADALGGVNPAPSVLAVAAAAAGTAAPTNGSAAVAAVPMTASLSYLREKARRLEARHGASTADYNRHAERAKKALNVLQPLTAAELDDVARAQHRYFTPRRR